MTVEHNTGVKEPMRESIVYLKGQFVPAPQAKINIYDYGIVMGATITDQLRTFRHKPFRLDEHVDRLFESARYARLALPLSREETVARTQELIRANSALLAPGDDLGVVFFLTPGENLGYAGSAAGFEPSEPTFCIHSFRLPFEAFRRFFTEGLHLVTPSTRHVPSQCLDQKIKHRSRLHWWIAEKEAQLVDSGAVPLLLDLQGNLTECSGANMLLVKNGVVYSPAATNMLRGTSRGQVAELCGELGIPFESCDLQVHDAINADEIFVTTTPYCMAPVTRINGLAVNDAIAGGPLFERILSAWSRQVDVDIRGQVLGLESGAEGSA
ncbi:MAG: aminotransferase class IV [Acidobacteria bacterium]|nr:aminotransferase class IV [Acidobacteriota bacterium]